MNWNNKVTQLLKIRYPFIQAPMLNVSTPAMIAAASNHGCLGSIPLGFADKPKIQESIRAVKKLTDKPFAVNLFPYKKLEQMPDLAIETLRAIYKKHDLPFYDTIPQKDPYTYYSDILEVLIEEKVPAVSFHFGVPDEKVVNLLRSNGITLVATATCVEEARIVEDCGADIVVAQGFEAGGNKGTFIEGSPPEVGLISLVPQIVDAVKIPVVAAGGLMESRSVAAAFMLGAQGAQLGSIFLRSKESGAPNSWKLAVKNSTDRSTVHTRAWSGRQARCIKNQFVTEMEKAEIYPSPVQQYLTTKLREAGRKNDNPEMQSLWAGQSASYAQEKTTEQILEEVIKTTGEKLSAPLRNNC